ncbi:flagellar protein FlhE [Cupriavidus sp. AU9028]|nr:flagellar protein FlhE [Cupriavidus sp. AU9028]MBY4898445.1 flagellar protein FlhE [Cupriavidus sp. AU9028]
MACAPAFADGGVVRANLGASKHSWTATVVPPALHGRGVRALSAPVLPTGYLAQSEGSITTVRWRYRFAGVAPIDLQAYLCSPTRCVLLDGAQGRTDAFRGDDASKGFVFAFQVPGRGPLTPVLQGQSGQVIVSYR